MKRASVLKPAGTLISTPGDGGREEQLDTVQCVHCARHWVYDAALRSAVEGKLGFCARCNGITCGETCQTCVHKEQLLDNIEAGMAWDQARLHQPIRVGQFHGTGDIWK